MYNIVLTKNAEEDIEYLTKTGNRGLLKKLESLIKELKEHPKTGTGKPEQLKHEFVGYWYRRISGEHRLIYRIDDEIVEVLILYCADHYKKK